MYRDLCPKNGFSHYRDHNSFKLIRVPDKFNYSETQESIQGAHIFYIINVIMSVLLILLKHVCFIEIMWFASRCSVINK